MIRLGLDLWPFFVVNFENFTVRLGLGFSFLLHSFEVSPLLLLDSQSFIYFNQIKDSGIKCFFKQTSVVLKSYCHVRTKFGYFVEMYPWVSYYFRYN